MNISSKLLQALREVLELPAFSDNAAHVYLMYLHDVDEKTIEHALRAWIRSGAWSFPSPADLRAFIESQGNTDALSTQEAKPCP